MITSRLCNATPFTVDWNFDRGVHIKITPDGYVDLNAVMAEQFRPDVPGTEAVRECMAQYGIFLRDVMVPYEVQALKALKDCTKFKESLYNDAKNNLRNRAASLGVFNEEAFAETLQRLGYNNLLAEVEKLKKRITLYETKVNKTGMDRPLHKQYDPKRTLLFLNPPKEFESEFAMEVFLSENPELAAKQKAWITQFVKSEKFTTKEDQ